MKKTPIEKLSDEEVAKRRKEYLLWGMIPATIFVLLFIFVAFNDEYKGMERYAMLGTFLSFPFIYQAHKYSTEHRKRNQD